MSVVALVLSACSGQAALASPTPGAVNVGLVVSLTGPASDTAELAIQGATTAVIQANAQHLAGPLPIRIVQVDDRSTPAGADAACSRLVTSDHVVAIVGFESASAIGACTKATSAINIPYFAGFSSTSDLCLANVFVFGFTPNQQVSPLIDFLQRKLSARTFYVLATDDAWGRRSAGIAATRIHDVGGTSPGVHLAEPNTVDFASQIAMIAAARPDVIVDALEPADEGTFERQLRSDRRVAGTKVAALSVDAAAARAIGPPAVGVYVAQDYNSADPSPATKSWQAELLARFGDGAIPSSAGAEMFDATLFMAAAIGQAKGTSGGAIGNATGAVSIQGPRGTIRLSPGGHGYATVSAHIGQVNKTFGVDLLEVSDPVAALACLP